MTGILGMVRDWITGRPTDHHCADLRKQVRDAVHDHRAAATHSVAASIKAHRAADETLRVAQDAIAALEKARDGS